MKGSSERRAYKNFILSEKEYSPFDSTKGLPGSFESLRLVTAKLAFAAACVLCSGGMSVTAPLHEAAFPRHSGKALLSVGLSSVKPATASVNEGSGPEPGPSRGSPPVEPALGAIGGTGPEGGGSAASVSTMPQVRPRYSLSLLGSYRKSLEIEAEVQRACDAYGVPLPLARAVSMYESGCNDRLVSGDGARGYFQVMPSTLRLLKVSSNIEAGVKYLSWLLRDFGREDDALAAYNGGPGRLSSGRPLPIETLQYVVGVGIYRTLLTYEEASIRAEASKLSLHRVATGEDWGVVSATTGIPVLELRLYNPYLATRPLRPGALVAYPTVSDGSLLDPPKFAPGSVSYYVTRRGDNYLLLAFALGIDLDQFRKDNTLWRVQVPFEGVRLVVQPGPPSLLQAASGAALSAGSTSPGGSLVGTLLQDGASGSVDENGSPASGRAAGRSSPPKHLTHTVRRGETLHRIASRYGVTEASIRLANKLKRSRVVAGQILRIPLD